MAEHPGAVRAQQYLDAFSNDDTEAMKDFFADDIVWHVGGNHHLSGDYRGKDQLFSYFATVRDLSGGLELVPESILASDQHTAMFTRVKGSRNGKTMDVLLAQVLRVGDDGRWTEYYALADDQASVDDFWS